MVDGGGLENRWVKASRVRILLPPPEKGVFVGSSGIRRTPGACRANPISARNFRTCGKISRYNNTCIIVTA